MNAPARDLPVGDRSIDFVFTMGVLIHQPEETLDKVMSEMVRASSRYVFCGEYFDTETVEVPYRGHDGRCSAATTASSSSNSSRTT